MYTHTPSRSLMYTHTHTYVQTLWTSVFINCRDRSRAWNDWTPLMCAAVYKRKKAIKYIIQQGAEPDLGLKSGETALMMCAALHRDIAMIKALVEAGEADVNAITAGGVCALSKACFGGHLQVVQYLISKGADPNIDTLGYTTPLMEATAAGHTKIVKFLCEKTDANIDAVQGNRTAADWAVLRKRKDLATYLRSANERRAAAAAKLAAKAAVEKKKRDDLTIKSMDPLEWQRRQYLQQLEAPVDTTRSLRQPTSRTLIPSSRRSAGLRTQRTGGEPTTRTGGRGPIGTVLTSLATLPRTPGPKGYGDDNAHEEDVMRDTTPATTVRGDLAAGAGAGSARGSPVPPTSRSRRGRQGGGDSDDVGSLVEEAASVVLVPAHKMAKRLKNVNDDPFLKEKDIVDGTVETDFKQPPWFQSQQPKPVTGYASWPWDGGSNQVRASGSQRINELNTTAAAVAARPASRGTDMPHAQPAQGGDGGDLAHRRKALKGTLRHTDSGFLRSSSPKHQPLPGTPEDSGRGKRQKPRRGRGEWAGSRRGPLPSARSAQISVREHPAGAASGAAAAARAREGATQVPKLALPG